MFYSFSYERSPTLNSPILHEGEERENNGESQRTCPGFCSTQVKQDQNSDSRLCSNAHLITLCKIWKPAQEGFRRLPAQKVLALFWSVVNMGQWRSLKSSRVCFNATFFSWEKESSSSLTMSSMQVGGMKKRLSCSEENPHWIQRGGCVPLSLLRFMTGPPLEAKPSYFRHWGHVLSKNLQGV